MLSLLFIEVLLDLKQMHLTIAQCRMQCSMFNPAVQSMLKASLCDWRYTHADVLFIEVLYDPGKIDSEPFFKAECSAKCFTPLC